MANTKGPVPLRSNSRSNRARILAVARQQLSENPDVAMDDIARAAGVVRRTLYGHFPGRAALLEALTDEGTETLLDTLRSTLVPYDTPEERLARHVLAGWPVGDRYRMLLALARRDLGDLKITEALVPPREIVTATVSRGQKAGVFSSHLPAEVLATALEALGLSLLEITAQGAWDGTAAEAAAATLIAAGVEPAGAVDTVRRVQSESNPQQ
jgi:AcrR family transcriptional regulator